MRIFTSDCCIQLVNTFDEMFFEARHSEFCAEFYTDGLGFPRFRHDEKAVLTACLKFSLIQTQRFHLTLAFFGQERNLLFSLNELAI